MSDAALNHAAGPAAALAAWSIRLYQRRISPYKGFVCAHRVLHRGESCSQFVLRIVQSRGVCQTLRVARRRFRECREAALLLAKNRSFEERLAADAEDKRRRLDATPGKPGPCFEHSDSCGQLMVIEGCCDVAGACSAW